MSDQDEPTITEPERARLSMRHLATASPAAKRVAGARRNPSVVGYEESAPHWLRVVAGWSWRMLVVVAAVALVFWATSRVLLLFIAVFLALVFTAVLRPVVDVLDRFMPRGIATALSILGSLLVVAGLFTYVGLSVAGQWESLGEQFNTGIGTILAFLEDSPLHLTVTTEDVQSWIAQGQQWLQQNSSAVASQALTSVGSAAQVLTALALATFCTIFFVTRGTEMWTWFLNQLPMRSRESWHVGGGVAWYTFSGYTRGTFLVAGADGILAVIILLALGVPLAAPLAVLVFIGAFIPLIGAPLAMVIAMVVALAANGIVNAILVGIGIALIGQFEGHILTPLVMGKQVSLHPVAVALGVTAGTLVAGILGAVISVPLIAVAWAVFARLRHLDPPTDFSDEEHVQEPPEETTRIADEEPVGDAR
ncbi:AI-2E family transporter [Actinotalea ferrariae]|uniref:AI-2E family transporter n=1 Tax=Actinotalea ferrariae TaxID=1386098 RepID=UPI0021AB9A9B|nr:AI-2E family transporter [Actinotalea ferrariae]